MLIIERVVLGVGILLMIIAIADLLHFIFEKKNRKNLGIDGVISALPSRVCILFLATSVGYFLIFPSLVLLANQFLFDGLGNMALYARLLGIFMMLLAIVVFYYSRANRIVYDEEKIIVYKPFKKGEEISWKTLKRVEFQADYCILYDENEQEHLKIYSTKENYEHFCQLARVKTK